MVSGQAQIIGGRATLTGVRRGIAGVVARRVQPSELLNCLLLAYLGAAFIFEVSIPVHAL